MTVPSDDRDRHGVFCRNFLLRRPSVVKQLVIYIYLWELDEIYRKKKHAYSNSHLNNTIEPHKERANRSQRNSKHGKHLHTVFFAALVLIIL